MTDLAVSTQGTLRLRVSPSDLPDPQFQPPTIAESGDPFAAVRVLHLLARVERGRAVRVDELTAALNAAHLDWAFASDVVVDVIVQAQTNWMADYRNSSGIVLEAGPYGATVTIEDSSRVDPWIVRQVERQAAACREVLRVFSRRDGRGFDD